MLNFPLLKRKILNNGALVISLLKLRPLLAKIGEGSIVIDCGANVGDITNQFAKTGATVYSFEPDPAAFARLEKRFKDFPNVILHQKAVWIENTEIPFYFHESRSEDELELTVSSSVISNKSNVSESNKVMVEAIDLVAFINDLDAKIALIKIDVEGAEIEILKHILAQETYKKFELAVVETHETKIPGHVEEVANIKAILEEKGVENVKLNWI
jgi:FkbM family methyltransferase